MMTVFLTMTFCLGMSCKTVPLPMIGVTLTDDTCAAIALMAVPPAAKRWLKGHPGWALMGWTCGGPEEQDS